MQEKNGVNLEQYKRMYEEYTLYFNYVFMLIPLKLAKVILKEYEVIRINMVRRWL